MVDFCKLAKWSTNSLQFYHFIIYNDPLNMTFYKTKKQAHDKSSLTVSLVDERITGMQFFLKTQCNQVERSDCRAKTG
jgi:hypothetical protein